MAKYILASASPPHLSAQEVAIHIAQNKARVIRDKIGNARLIIAADTIVVLENEIIGKPSDRQDAIDILSKLSGKTHKVITGVAIMGAEEKYFADVTEVEFNQLSQKEIEFYIDKYQPYDKAGAYAIQEWIGVIGIKRINGDFYNVMGLPVSKVVQALKKMESEHLKF
jgi:septum formation protein